MRHSEKAIALFNEMGTQAGTFSLLCKRSSSKTPETDKFDQLALCISTMADGMGELGAVAKDMYDKLDQIERKLGH